MLSTRREQARHSHASGALDFVSRIQDEQAIVLHTRAYRESSLIVQFLTASHGRIAAVARGARRVGRNRGGTGLQPFYQGLLSCSGRGALVSLNRFDLAEARWFTGNRLASAYYMAELVVRLTREWESAPRLFGGVEWAMGALAEVDGVEGTESCLRQFEKLLLEELGYGLDFGRDAATGEGIDEAAWYGVSPESGFIAGPEGEGYPGTALKAIDAGCFEAAATRRFAKRIFRTLLADHLGPAPLMSRRLYRRGI